MRLIEADAALFLAVVHVFISALPPSPRRRADDGATDDWDQRRRYNAITFMRFEVRQLATVLTPERAAFSLPDDAVVDRASEALEDILNLLDGLVDSGIICNSGTAPKGPPTRFPKLCILDVLLRSHTHIPATDGSIRIHDPVIPDSVLQWINYPIDGAEALQYRKIANPIQQFNDIMRGIYETHMVNAELGLAQVEAIQVFHPCRRPEQDRAEEKNAEADIQRAYKISESSKVLADLFSRASHPCQPPHSAHIHLSGFEDSEIDMLISVCGVAKTRWHIVYWVNPAATGTTSLRQDQTDSICSALRLSSTSLTRLRIQLHKDGCWKSWPPGPGDRVRKCAAPKKTLDEWLCPVTNGQETAMSPHSLTKKNKLRLATKIARSLLCFVGSPLLQGPWRSENILVSETTDKSSDDHLSIEPYIHGKLTECLDQDSSEEARCRRTKCSILDLALVLWQVFVGEKVTVAEENQDDDEDETDLLFDALNMKEIKSRESSFIDIFCLDIIANCLNLYGMANKIDEAFRTKLYWDIVKPLITSFQDYTRSNRKSATATTTDHRHSPPVPCPPECSTGATHDSIWQKKFKNTSKLQTLYEHKSDEREVKTNMWPKQCVLFDADDRAYLERTRPDLDTEDFFSRMTTFVTDNILPLPDELAGNIRHERQKRTIRIAVLDTGIRIDESDEILQSGQKRIILKQNFHGEDKTAYVDSYGHGTHVTRLLLRLAPLAEIIVAKISESKQLQGGEQIVKALNWVGGRECDADIIVMSFGLGYMPHPEIARVIQGLVTKGKLLFAAASNGGGNDLRAFPAKAAGVFCVHVSDGKGNKTGINPSPVSADNFSTLGHCVDSIWNGKQVYISGSSFATPIAASIAANALEYIRHTLTDEADQPDYFYQYQGMRALFCCLSDGMDGYDYVKPWKRHLWDQETEPENTCAALRAIATYGPERWIKLTSEDSFYGFT